jgi:hypothetical protein
MAFGMSCADVLSIIRLTSNYYEQFLNGSPESTRLRYRQFLSEVEMLDEACKSVAKSLE